MLIKAPNKYPFQSFSEWTSGISLIYNQPVKIGTVLRQGISVLFLAATAACNLPLEFNGPTEITQTPVELNTDNPRVTATADQDWVVITKEQTEEMNLGSWMVETDGFWTPSENDVIALEEKIAEYLGQNSTLFNRQPPVREDLREYQRQFIGLEREGSKTIYGNYFCNNLGLNWHQDIISVDGGGDCYFQVEYDVDKGMFTMLMVNGES